MRINTSRWNRVRYTALTPIYDIIGRVFTKFRKLSIDGLQLTRGDKVLNYFTNALFSNINRSFEAIAKETGLEVVSNTIADFRGNYRIVILTKQY
ncbi:hypothetical protein TH61_05550 [Rufibacter sp. DG15C]|nr:hypothetical protein TH61_05550 [Rufibacter sp. DG15C]